MNLLALTICLFQVMENHSYLSRMIMVYHQSLILYQVWLQCKCNLAIMMAYSFLHSGGLLSRSYWYKRSEKRLPLNNTQRTKRKTSYARLRHLAESATVGPTLSVVFNEGLRRCSTPGRHVMVIVPSGKLRLKLAACTLGLDIRSKTFPVFICACNMLLWRCLATSHVSGT